MQLERLLIACSFEDITPLDSVIHTLKAKPSILTWNGIQYCLDHQDISTHPIQTLQNRAFQATLIFTQPHQSCYALAYLCYLAGIPIRIGQSVEFAGGVLSKWILPIADPVPLQDYHLHLLNQCDLEF